MGDTARNVRITGVVQGVGFRAWTQSRAARLGLDGWVRNDRDGSVEALISGEAERVDRMLDDLWKGPLGSAVDAVVVEEAQAPDVPGFRIRR
jgi:acylphosphatase